MVSADKALLEINSIYLRTNQVGTNCLNTTEIILKYKYISEDSLMYCKKKSRKTWILVSALSLTSQMTLSVLVDLILAAITNKHQHFSGLIHQILTTHVIVQCKCCSTADSSMWLIHMWLIRGPRHLLSCCYCHPSGLLCIQRHRVEKAYLLLKNPGLEVTDIISVHIHCGNCSFWLGSCLPMTTLPFGRRRTKY